MSYDLFDRYFLAIIHSLTQFGASVLSLYSPATYIRSGPQSFANYFLVSSTEEAAHTFSLL